MHRLALWFSIGALGIILGTMTALLKAEYAVIVLSAGVALISLLWMHYLVAVFSIKRLTVPTAFYWAYFLRVYLPAHVIFLEDQGPAKWLYMLSVLAVLLLVPLGIALAQIIFRRGRRDTNRFFKSSDWPAVPFKTGSIWFLGLLGISALVITLHLRQLPSIPIVQLLRNPGQAMMIAYLRESTFKTLGVPSWLKYLMTWTRDLFLPLLTMLCWAEYRISKKKKWLIWGLCTLCVGLFYASITLAKAPVAQLILVLVLFYWLWFDIRLSPKLMFAAVVPVMLFPFLVDFLKYGMRFTFSDILAVIQNLWHRIFYITADVPYHYFDLFPIGGKFLGGRTIGLLSGIMGWEHFNTSRYVYDVIMPGSIASGYANSAFIGDLYADFGMWGVLLGSCLVGFVLQVLQGYLERQPKTTLLMTIYTFVCVAVTGLMSTSINVTLMTGGVITAVMILWCARYLDPVLLVQDSMSRRSEVSDELTERRDMPEDKNKSASESRWH